MSGTGLYARILLATHSINRIEFGQLSSIMFVLQVINTFVTFVLFTMLSPLHRQIPLLNHLYIDQLFLEGGPTAWLLPALSISLGLKLFVAALLLIRAEQPRPIQYQTLFGLVNLHEVLAYTLDLAIVISCTSNTQYFLLVPAVVNFLFCLCIKFYREVYFSNYAFMCGNPYRKLANLLCYSLKNSAYAIALHLIPAGYTQIGLGIASIYVIGSLKSNLLDTPYISDFTADVCIVQVGLNCSCIMTGVLAYVGELFSGNSVVTFALLSVLVPIVLVLVRVNRNRRLLLVEADRIETHKQSNIRLQSLFLLISSGSELANRLLASFAHMHLSTCFNAECACKSTAELWDFHKNTRVLSNSAKGKDSNGRIFLRHLLMSQCRENEQKFPSEPSTYLLHLSAMTNLGVYTRAYQLAIHIEQSFGKDLSLSDWAVLAFLRLNNEEDVKKRLLSLNPKDIQTVRKIEECNDQLFGFIEQVMKGRIKLWNYLNNSFPDMKTLFDMHQHEFQLRGKLDSVYEECRKLNCNSFELWRNMHVYARFIIRDDALMRRVNREVVVDRQIISSGLMRGFIESQSGMSLLNNPNTCLVKISHHSDSRGNITWHCKNLRKVFGFRELTKVMNQNVSILIPQIYRPHHDGYLRSWLENPQGKRMHRYVNAYIQTYNNVVLKALLYIRLCPSRQDFELFGMIHKLEGEEYMLLSKEMKAFSPPRFLTDLLLYGTKPEEQIDMGLLSVELLELEQELEDEKGSTTNIKKTMEISIARFEKYREIQEEYEQQKKKLEALKLPADKLKQALRGLKVRFNSHIESQCTQRKLYLNVDLEVLPVPTAQGPSYCLVMESIKKESPDIIASEFQYFNKQGGHHIDSMSDHTNENETKPLDFGETESARIRGGDSEEATISKVCADIHRHYRNKELIVVMWVVFAIFVILAVVGVFRLLIFSGMASRYQAVLASDPSEVLETLKLAVSGLSLVKYYWDSSLPIDSYLEQLSYLSKYALELVNRTSLRASQTLNNVTIHPNGLEREIAGDLFVEAIIARCHEISMDIADGTGFIAELYEYLHDNMDELAAISRSSAKSLMMQAAGVLDGLQLANFLLFSMVVVVALVVVGVVRRYVRTKQEERYAVFTNFVQLDMKVTKALERYYSHCESHFEKLIDSPIGYQGLMVGEADKRRSAKEIVYPRTLWAAALALFLLVLCDTVMTIRTNSLREVCYSLNTALQLALQASSSLSNANLYFMEMNFEETKSIQPEFFRNTNATVPPVVTLLGTLNGFYSSNAPDRLISMRRLLTGDLCDVLFQSLLQFQQNICLAVQPRILTQTGLTSMNSYYHRQMLQFQLRIQSSQMPKAMIASNADFELMRSTVFLQYKALQLVRKELLEVGVLQITALSILNRNMLAVDLTIKLLLLLAVAYCYRRERLTFHRFYQYLTVVPEEEFRDNCYLKAFLVRLVAAASTH